MSSASGFTLSKKDVSVSSEAALAMVRARDVRFWRREKENKGFEVGFARRETREVWLWREREDREERADAAAIGGAKR